MDRLRFRAWNKYRKEMIAPYDGDFIKWHAPSNYADHYVIMQCTGLRDKNGGLIYEGDVVKTDYDNHVVIYDNDVWPDLDGYDNGDYYEGFFPQSHQWARFEVIGNIWENPELVGD